MRAEQRDPTLQRRVAANQQWEEPVPEAKPYDIPKQLVGDAYLRVKANEVLRAWMACRWRRSRRI